MDKYALWMQHDYPFKIALVNQNYLFDILWGHYWPIKKIFM